MGNLLQAELVRQLAADTTLAEVERALQDLFGLVGVVLLRDRGGSVEIFPRPEAKRLNPLCAAVRSRPEGLSRCSVCQTSMALRAPFEGISQHVCHTGTYILAAKCQHLIVTFFVGA